ncbi:DUF6614 family protein [Pseudoroseicyclus sp. CXY001]|uniref:DUF6614 family protein n=1 Tax=Pseudoroseicyclus sp. CXY001 TaxID=3242492 RepID=UPI00358DC081
MNLYHCMIELKDGAKALLFARAVETWLGLLQERRMIASWRLFRRKLGLSSGAHSDFILEVEVGSLVALERAFTSLSELAEDEEVTRLYDQVHAMILKADVGLYRPYPDASQRERIALI